MIQGDGWNLFRTAVNAVPRIYLWGPPGIGKSRTALERLRERMDNKEVRQITLNEDIVAQELMGHYVPKGNVFEWRDGPTTKAFREGEGLVINELGRAGGAVKDMFLGILDDPSVALLTLPNDDKIRSGEGFQVVATSNSPPHDLDEALRDRFDVVMKVSHPYPDIIFFLNRKVPGLGDLIYDSYKDPERAISPRRGFSFIKLLDKKMSCEDSAFLSFGEGYKDVLSVLKMRA